MKDSLGRIPGGGGGGGGAESGHGPAAAKLGLRTTLAQMWVAAVVNLGSVAAGASLGFTAVALERMANENATRPLTDTDKSWIG